MRIIFLIEHLNLLKDRVFLTSSGNLFQNLIELVTKDLETLALKCTGVFYSSSHLGGNEFHNCEIPHSEKIHHQNQCSYSFYNTYRVGLGKHTHIFGSYS